MNSNPYLGWHITRKPKPIPNRRHDYDFWHDDYDGAPDGNHLAGTASSVQDAMEQIFEIEEEQKIERRCGRKIETSHS